jgi:hypothetical protein
MKQPLIYFTLVCALFLTSCQKHESSVPRKDALQKGNQLLDEGHYDEAIDYFTDLLQDDNSPQFRLALASAYAARAGLRRSDFIAIADVALMKKAVPSDWSDIFKTLYFIQTLKERWDYLPSAKLEGLQDLKMAIATLEPSSAPSVRLFSAALRTIYIKSTMGPGLDKWLQLDHKDLCRQNLAPLLKWSENLVIELQALVVDIAGAYPSKKEQFKKVQQDLENAHSQIQEWSAERSVLCP